MKSAKEIKVFKSDITENDSIQNNIKLASLNAGKELSELETIVPKSLALMFQLSPFGSIVQSEIFKNEKLTLRLIIRFYRNNIYLVLTNVEGRVIKVFTSRRLGFRGKLRLSYIALMELVKVTITFILKVLLAKDVKLMIMFKSGELQIKFLTGVLKFLTRNRHLKEKNIQVTYVSRQQNLPFGGVRLPKKMRK